MVYTFLCQVNGYFNAIISAVTLLWWETLALLWISSVITYSQSVLRWEVLKKVYSFKIILVFAYLNFVHTKHKSQFFFLLNSFKTDILCKNSYHDNLPKITEATGFNWIEICVPVISSLLQTYFRIDVLYCSCVIL